MFSKKLVVWAGVGTSRQNHLRHRAAGSFVIRIVDSAVLARMEGRHSLARSAAALVALAPHLRRHLE